MFVGVFGGGDVCWGGGVLIILICFMVSVIRYSVFWLILECLIWNKEDFNMMIFKLICMCENNKLNNLFYNIKG